MFREEAAKLTGAMVRLIGNFDIAEEVVQDSLVAALEMAKAWQAGPVEVWPAVER